MRERSPGIWEVRAHLGRGPNRRPVQVGKTVRGGKREAQRVAAELTLKPAAAPSKITVGELLDLWLDQRADTWAPQTLRNQQSRVRIVKRDALARIPLVRLTAVDVDRWHARLARSGTGEGSIRNQHLVVRAAVTHAVRWGWLNTNVVAVAQLGRRKQAPRGSTRHRGCPAPRIWSRSESSNPLPPSGSGWPRPPASDDRSWRRCGGPIWTRTG